MTTLKTYRAPTMSQALAEVKKDLGAEAVIVNTRSLKTGGLAGFGAKPVVEITAAPASPVQRSATLRPPAAPRPGPAVMTAPARAQMPAVGAQPPVIPAARPLPAPAPATPSARTPQREPAESDWSPLEFTRLASDLAREEPPGPASAPPAKPAATPVVAAQRHVEVKPPAAISPAPAPLQSVPPARVPEPEPAGPARLAVKAPLAPVSDSARATLEDELASIRRLMGQVLQFSRRAATAGGGVPVPPAGGVSEHLQRAYAGLLDAAVSPELADHLLANVQARLEPAELQEPDLIHHTLARLLAEAIPVIRAPGRPGRQQDGRPLTIALVGPTGVGKTTTIAKLAALYKLRHGKRVGLLTTDTYRIAAVEQLRTYARIIGLPVKVAADAQDLAEGLAELRDLDVVLIDTAGRSPSDRARLEELSAGVRGASPHETHLVLAATAAESVLLRTAERFAALQPDRLILTKLDEAPQAGPVASIPARAGLPLSYITTGQEVPDDLELASAERLARRILLPAMAACETAGV